MKLTAKVESTKLVAENTYETTFYIPDTKFNFEAGQYITVTLPNLKHLEVREQFRDFSVASSPNKLPYLSIVFRGSGSAFKKDLLGLVKGSEVIVEGPAGIFTLPQDFKRQLVFIAGGVGIAPFHSIIGFISENKLPYEITLIYCNRSTESSAYLADLEETSKQIPSVTLIKVFGLLEEKNIVKLTNQNQIWYIAGPSGMVKTARKILEGLDIMDINIRTEEFTGY